MADRKFSAILAAGGSGTRFGGEINKVYLPLGGQTVIEASLDKLLNHPLIAEVIVVYRKEDEAVLMPILAEKGTGSAVPLLAVPGGETRRDSVRRGLALVSSGRVLVHDAARPFWDPAWIDALAEALDEVPGASAAVPSPDTVKITDERGRVVMTTERSRTWLVQTPQVFKTELYRACAYVALKDRITVTDDASVAEHAGFKVTPVDCGRENIKITSPLDFTIAEAIIAERERENG